MMVWGHILGKLLAYGEMEGIWSLVHVEIKAGSGNLANYHLTHLVNRAHGDILFYLVIGLFF